jgi:hypothetical protein
VPSRWDDPELDKADKADKRALLSIFFGVIVISATAFLLTFFEDLSSLLAFFEQL